MAPPKKGRGPLRVDYKPTNDLKPHPQNSRTHTPRQIDEIIRSIEAVGWTKPIIVDEKLEILAGHGAHQAALQMGLDEIPTIMRAGLTSGQKKAYRIADNRLAEQSTWDEKILATEFAELKRMGYDLSLTGFDPSEIEFMLAPPPAITPEPPAATIEKRTVSKLGDLWIMGEHRLLCADSTKPASYKTLLAGRRAQCVFTDPPYGISYAAPSGKFEVIKGDDLRRGQLKTMLNNAFASAVFHAEQDAGWYVWHASSTRDDFSQAMAQAGLVELGYLIWEKPGAVLGWSDYRYAHEPCFYAAKQGTKPAFYGDRTGTTIWRIEAAAANGEPTSIGNGLIITTPDGEEVYLAPAPPKGKKVCHLHLANGAPILIQPASDCDDVWKVSRDSGHGKDDAIHPTMKPVALARRAIVNSTKEGEIVLDVFCGGASTIMAAEQTKRVGYGMELDPHYIDASVRRWQELTGKEATHGTEKKTFQAIAKARGKA